MRRVRPAGTSANRRTLTTVRFRWYAGGGSRQAPPPRAVGRIERSAPSRPGRGHERRGGAGHVGRARPPGGRRAGVAAGEPGVVGRRRRRLPRRARRGHRRRRLRLVPGGPARGRRAAARGRGRARVLEVGCGSAPCARWLAAAGAEPVALDLSRGMLRHAAELERGDRVAVPLVQAGAERLPFADASSTSRARRSAAVPFVAEPDRVMREVARVLRPGGRWVFAVNHPMRWMFSDDPGPDGLVVTQSYFDRTPYVEVDATGRRPTSSTTAPSATGSATSSPRPGPRRPGRAGVARGRETVWGQWSPLRGGCSGHGDLRWV